MLQFSLVVRKEACFCAADFSNVLDFAIQGYYNVTIDGILFRCVPINSAKRQLAASCLSACINAVSTGRIFAKFDIKDFYEDLSKHFKFGETRREIADTLHEELNVHFYC